MTSLIAAICSSAGVEYLHHERMHGGDINDAYRIETGSGSLFLKMNAATDFPGMFLREAEGLEALRNASALKVPGVIKVDEIQGKQFLVLEWLEKGSPGNNFWLQFGRQLSAIHQNTNDLFGWHADNYIGSLTQKNNFDHSWASFYANCRLLPLAKKLFDGGAFSAGDVKQAEILCNKLDHIFPAEKPALLHGDLWSGNFMVSVDGSPAIYDPAVYYGHREMDIAMTRLFGGFSSVFYEAYDEVFPLQKDWQQRISLAQLYPLLVHAVLFGGGYINSCRNIIRQWC